MTGTEKQALALVTQLQEEDDGKKYSHAYYFDALCRAIEQHEAFKREVSDAVEVFRKQSGWVPAHFTRFIIAKPDPLVEALNDMKDGRAGPTRESYAACLRAALAARGLEIREVGHD